MKTEPTGIVDPETTTIGWKTYLERISAWVPDDTKEWPDEMYDGHEEGCAWVHAAETQDALAVLDFVLARTPECLRDALALPMFAETVSTWTKSSKPDYVVGFFHGVATMLSLDLARRGGRLS